MRINPFYSLGSTDDSKQGNINYKITKMSQKICKQEFLAAILGTTHKNEICIYVYLLSTNIVKLFSNYTC